MASLKNWNNFWYNFTVRTSKSGCCPVKYFFLGIKLNDFLRHCKLKLVKSEREKLKTISINYLCMKPFYNFCMYLNFMKLIIFFIRHWNLRIFTFVDFCFQIFDLHFNIIMIILNQLFQCSMRNEQS